VIDLEELHKVVDKCDVFTIGFPLSGADDRTPGLLAKRADARDRRACGTVEERFWLGSAGRSSACRRVTFFV
jgi:hypothetical protein